MPFHKKAEIQKFIIKIGIASCIRGLLFFYQSEHIDQNPSREQYYQEHQAPLVEQRPISTVSLPTIQDKILRTGARSDEEKTTLQDKISEIANTIDTLMIDSFSLANTIQSITIHKEKGTSRGYSNHHHMVLYYGDMSTEEFLQVFVHELGHIVDLGSIEGKSLQKDKVFTEFGDYVFQEDDLSLFYYALSRESESKRKNTMRKKDFCSVYGMTNPFEDFAECMHLYLLHNDYFNQIKNDSLILQKKYDFFAKIFSEEHISKSITGTTKYIANKRYWDTTRMF